MGGLVALLLAGAVALTGGVDAKSHAAKPPAHHGAPHHQPTPKRSRAKRKATGKAAKPKGLATTVVAAPVAAGDAPGPTPSGPAIEPGASAPAVIAPHATTVNAIDRGNGTFAFTLSSLTVASGPVTFSLVNRDSAAHNLSVRFAGGTTANLADVQGGQATSVSSTLAPGTYTLFCALPGHEAVGMRATLTVVP